MLFWKGFREAYEIEYGYGSYEEKKSKWWFFCWDCKGLRSIGAVGLDCL